MAGERTSTGRSSLLLAGWTLVSRLVGLLRVLVIGALLGPTFFANILQAGYVLPNTVFTVLAGPVLGMVVVPVVARALSAHGIERARELVGLIAGRLYALAGMCAVVLALASPGIAWLLVLGVPAPDRPRAWLLAIVLVLFVAPQVVLYAVINLGVAVQQSRRRFALAAAAPTTESVGTIVTVVIAVSIFGMAVEVDRVPVAMMLLLGVGNTLAVVLLAAIQAAGAARAGIPLRPRSGWRSDPEARDALRRLGRSIPVAGLPAGTNYALVLLATTVPGGVLVVQLCYQVFYALSYVGARAVSMVALPGLARAKAKEAPARFGEAWRRGLYFALIASLPPLVLLGFLSDPTADVLMNGAMRGSAAATVLGGCLVIVGVAQLAGGLHDYARQALFARLDDRGPRMAVTVGAVALLVSAGLTLLMPAGPERLLGLVLALLVGELCAAPVVLARLRAAIRPEAMTSGRQLLGLAAACLALVPAAALGRYLTAETPASERFVELAVLVGCGGLGLGCFGVVVWLTRERRSTAPAAVE